MELTEAVKDLLVQTAKALKGSARRLFMARTVQALGERGQLLAERELSWNRGTLRKGMHELERGIVCIDACSSRGSKRSERARTLRTGSVNPLGEHRFADVRHSRTRTDGITANAFGGIHPGRVACETHQRVLGGGVSGTGGTAVNAGGRGNVDDGTSAMREHVPKSPPTRKHGSIQINAQDATPDVIGQLSHALHIVHHASVVAEHVQATVGAERKIDEMFRRRLIGNVALCTDNRSTTRLNTRDGGVEPLRVPVTGDDACTLCCKACCDRQSHPGACSRDHRNLSLKSHRCLLKPAKFDLIPVNTTFT